MSDFKDLPIDHPIYIATKEIQRRKHHKKRINKKWQKRYGYYELNYVPHNEVVMMDNGVLWMTKKTYMKITENILTGIEILGSNAESEE